MDNLFQPAGQIKICQEGRVPSFVLISRIVASGMIFPDTVQSGDSIGIKCKFNTLGTRLGHILDRKITSRAGLHTILDVGRSRIATSRGTDLARGPGVAHTWPSQFGEVVVWFDTSL